MYFLFFFIIWPRVTDCKNTSQWSCIMTTNISFVTIIYEHGCHSNIARLNFAHDMSKVLKQTCPQNAKFSNGPTESRDAPTRDLASKFITDVAAASPQCLSCSCWWINYLLALRFCIVIVQLCANAMLARLSFWPSFTAGVTAAILFLATASQSRQLKPAHAKWLGTKAAFVLSVYSVFHWKR